MKTKLLGNKVSIWAVSALASIMKFHTEYLLLGFTFDWVGNRCYSIRSLSYHPKKLDFVLRSTRGAFEKSTIGKIQQRRWVNHVAWLGAHEPIVDNSGMKVVFLSTLLLTFRHTLRSVECLHQTLQPLCALWYSMLFCCYALTFSFTIIDSFIGLVVVFA